MASQTLIAGAGADDAAVGTIAWTTTGNITADDTTRAQAISVVTGSPSRYLKSSSHGFTIPAGATIDGIVVEIDKGQNTGAQVLTDLAVKIVKGGVVGSTDKASATLWSTSGVDAIATYGSSSDKWGETWTDTDINASNFGVVIQAQSSSATARNARVDFIRITVHYTATGATPVDGAVLDLVADVRAEANGGVLDAVWDLRAEANAGALDALWDLRAEATGAALDLPWDLAAAADGSVLEAIWDLAAVFDGAVLDSVWDLYATADGGPLELIWDFGGAVNGAPQRLVADLRAAVDSPSLEVAWDLRTPVDAAALTGIWDVRSAADAAQLALLWDLVGRVDGPSLELIWRLYVADPEGFDWFESAIGMQPLGLESEINLTR